MTVQLWDLSGIRAVVQQKPPARLVMFGNGVLGRRGRAKKLQRGAVPVQLRAQVPGQEGGGGGGAGGLQLSCHCPALTAAPGVTF